MIPGGLLLLCLRVAGLTEPASLVDVAKDEPWKTIIMPLIGAAMAYLLGALLDGCFRSFFRLAERFGRCQYEKALKDFLKGNVLAADKGLPPRPLPANASAEEFHHDAWQWLALKIGPKNTAAFSLAHRFQAESRLFVLSSVPAAYLAFSFLKIPCAAWVAAAVGIIIFVLFIFTAFSSERNRWIWTLAAICQLQKDEKDESGTCTWPPRWGSSGEVKQGGSAQQTGA